MSNHEPILILPAEFIGNAAVDPDGSLDVGGVKVPLGNWGHPVSVYVRRMSNDLSVCEVVLARHDGLATEELNEQNRQADEYPLGPKEYWRGEMVGKYTCGADGHLMTDEDFEAEWWEDG